MSMLNNDAIEFYILSFFIPMNIITMVCYIMWHSDLVKFPQRRIEFLLFQLGETQRTTPTFQLKLDFNNSRGVLY